MCYQLWIVSPLTLSEIRSMLPSAFTADMASPADQRALRSRLPGAQTVAMLRLGGCACLLRTPHDGEDERHLRRRYAALGLSRDRIIAALDRHRRGTAPAGEPATWRIALASFVAEHARNAGATLFYLGFGEAPAPVAAADTRIQPETTAAEVRASPDTWLVEGTLIRVGP